MAFNLDQSYVTGQDNDYATTGQGNLRRGADNNTIIGQSFTPTLSGKLNRVELYLLKFGTPSGNVFVEIRNDGADPTVTSLLGTSSNVDVSTLATSYTFTAFDFPSPVTLTPGVEYWILLNGTYTASTVNGAVWGEDVTSPSYSGGIWGRFGNGSPAWEESNTIDGLFKQYSNDVASPSRTSYAFFM